MTKYLWHDYKTLIYLSPFPFIFILVKNPRNRRVLLPPKTPHSASSHGHKLPKLFHLWLNFKQTSLNLNFFPSPFLLLIRSFVSHSYFFSVNLVLQEKFNPDIWIAVVRCWIYLVRRCKVFKIPVGLRTWLNFKPPCKPLSLPALLFRFYSYWLLFFGCSENDRMWKMNEWRWVL